MFSFSTKLARIIFYVDLILIGMLIMEMLLVPLFLFK